MEAVYYMGVASPYSSMGNKSINTPLLKKIITAGFFN
jgi:hypothetical protein